jgi:hypothetical protein
MQKPKKPIAPPVKVKIIGAGIQKKDLNQKRLKELEKYRKQKAK